MSSLEDIPANQPRNGDDPLLTASVAAKRIGVTAATVRRWIKDGDMESEPVGPKRRKLRTSVVEKFSPRSTRNISGRYAQVEQNARSSE